ncbi:MAG: hypothetical protein H0X25_22400 [Acidobacteriales bacterium]|nr:hypothetical protein [Terriglobales bacterium]
MTSKIDTWGFNSSTGLPTTAAKVRISAGPQPFGFSFDKAGRLVVSEMTASPVWTDSISSNGTLTLISNQVPDNGSQACWVAITNNTHWAALHRNASQCCCNRAIGGFSPIIHPMKSAGTS